MYHKPVLLMESIDGLAIKDGGTYVDVTYGGGGHSQEILNRLKNGRLICFDQDPDAKKNLIADNRLDFIPQNFRYLKNFLKEKNAVPVDGLLADLGVSSHQFDEAERGFSIRENGPLDMRMNPNSGLNAKKVINTYEENALIHLFSAYGEIKNARTLTTNILQTRANKAISTTDELKEIALKSAPKGKEHKYLAQVFQALRIEVNGELDVLKKLLEQSIEVLNDGGRLSIITYHSLEDRLVKNFIKTGNFQGRVEKDFYGNPIAPLKAVNKKPITPSEKEIKENKRARSAKLRIAEKLKAA